MAETTIWHNPRCAKSRETLALLEARGITPRLRLYLADAPTPAELATVLRRLDAAPTALLRFKEPRARELGLSPKDDRTDEAWLRLLSENPVLIERPVVLHGDRAALGRPPQAVLGILPATRPATASPPASSS